MLEGKKEKQQPRVPLSTLEIQGSSSSSFDLFEELQRYQKEKICKIKDSSRLRFHRSADSISARKGISAGKQRLTDRNKNLSPEAIHRKHGTQIIKDLASNVQDTFLP